MYLHSRATPDLMMMNFYGHIYTRLNTQHFLITYHCDRRSPNFSHKVTRKIKFNLYMSVYVYLKLKKKSIIVLSDYLPRP